MTHRSPARLIDLLEAAAPASAPRCGLEPRLLEMLIDRDSIVPRGRQWPHPAAHSRPVSGPLPGAPRSAQEASHVRR